ncbi:MAG TPA: DUF4019 domain-containing protein [Candidatus Acidoferrum sp.]|nr:DUF4019 domain-containing protein [Candidatus Acidoferrum sp.]
MRSACKCSVVGRLLSLAVISTAALFVCSCGSMTKDTTLAKEAVVGFHAQLDSGQYTVLYEAADPKLHSITSEPDFVKFLDAVHRKLGAVRGSNLQNWRAGWYAGQGTTIVLTYNTSFAAGSGTEQFTWHIDNNRALLYGYHINSADLIEK